jgi:predicted dehydrogenase
MDETRVTQRGLSATSNIRVAMIGAGKMANRVHYPSLASFPDVELAAICDLDPDRLTPTADRYGIDGRYADYREMIERVAPDAVYSIGPSHLMYDTWVWCLQHGVNLFVEKPLGLTLHQAQMLADLAARNGCVTQVGFQRRTAPIAMRMRDACLARGPITHAVVRFYKNQLAPFTGSIDHLLDDGIHAIDTLRWLCEGDVVDIQSSVRRIGVPDINLITATIAFSTGAVGVMLANWSTGRRIFSIEMHAPGICADVDPERCGRLYADGDESGIHLDTWDAAQSDEFFIYGGFQAKSREFIDAIQTGTQPGSHFADALQTMDVAHRILAQSTLRGQ